MEARKAKAVKWVFPGDPEFKTAIRLSFCPTGPGGGIDNSCGKGESVDVPKHIGEIFRTLAKEGGFTYNPRAGTQPKKGWAVSVDKAHEQRLKSDPTKPVTVKDMLNYWKTNKEFLSKEGSNFGGWVDDEKAICLDVSIVIDSQAEAERLARANDQDGIFNLETKQFVSTR